MHGEEETGQTVETFPESIRIGIIQAQAGIGTRLMLSNFNPSPFQKIWLRTLPALTLPSDFDFFKSFTWSEIRCESLKIINL